MNCSVWGAREDMLPGPAVLFQPADQSPPGPGPATRQVPGPSSPPLCPSLDPLFEASFVPSNKRKNKKRPRALDLATPECKTRGRRRVVPFSGAGGWGAAGTRGGPRRGRAPGWGRWDESSTQGPGQRGSHPLGYPSGAGAEGGAHLEPRQGGKDSHLARDGAGLGTKRASLGSRGAWAPLGPAGGGKEGTRS